MATEIDNHIVQMKLQNGQFESGAKQTMETLDRLKEKLNLNSAAKSFESISDASNKVSLFGLGQAIENISSRFTNLGIIGITALQNIANSAINTGKTMLKALTIDPISQGFGEYELKMGSIQTIMAGTGESLETVSKRLDELNTYADRTIYNFADMTSNIGKFTNSGVKLNDAVAAIQGIANEAAVSGANAQQASHAMYNFAQALSSGYVKLIDWKSIEIANMATVEFKEQLLETALALGTVVKQGEFYRSTTTNAKGDVSDLFNATKNFNDNLQSQWMTTEVLTQTLGKYADETTDIGKKAFAAATEVKTFSMMVDALKEAVGSGWAQTWENIFGDFEEAKELWTRINNVVGAVIDKQSKSRNDFLSEWKELGGRTSTIEAFANAFSALAPLVSAVSDGFSEIFPPMTGKRFVEITKKIEDFTSKIKISDDALASIKDSAKGIFSIFKIGYQIISPFVGSMFRLSTYILPPLVGMFFSITGAVGRVISSFENLNRKTKIFSNISKFVENIVGQMIWPFRMLFQIVQNGFDSIGDINTDNIVKSIQSFSGWLARLTYNINNWFDKARNAAIEFLNEFSGLDSSSIKSFVESVVDAFSNIYYKTSIRLNNTYKNVSKFVKEIEEKIKSFKDSPTDGIDVFVDNIKKSFGPLTAVADFFSAVWDKIKGAFDKISPKIVEASSGIWNELRNLGDSFMDGIKTMNFDRFLGLLNTGLIGTILIKMRSLTKGFKNFDAKTGKFLDSIKDIFEGLTGILKSFQESIRANVLIKIAVAMGLLTMSIMALSTIESGTLTDSIAALTIVLTTLTLSMRVIGGLDMTRNAGNIIAISISMLALAGSIRMLSGLDLGVVTAMAAILSIFITVVSAAVSKAKGNISKDLLSLSAVFIAISSAISSLVMPVIVLSLLKPNKLAQGVLAVGVLIGGLVAAAKIAAKGETDLKRLSNGLVSLAFGLTLITAPIAILGNMGIPTLLKGILSAASAIVLIGGAMGVVSRNVESGQLKETASAFTRLSMAVISLSIPIKILSSINSAALVTTVLVLPALIAGIGLAMKLFPRPSVINQVTSGMLKMSAAFGVLSVGIMLLAPALITLSLISWAGLGKDMLIVVGSLAALMAMSALMSKQSKAIKDIAIALLAFSAAFALLGIVAPTIEQNADSIISAIDVLVRGAVMAIVSSAGSLVDGILYLIQLLLNSVATRIPEIGASLARFIISALDVIQQYAPAIVTKAMDVLSTIINLVTEKSADIGLGVKEVIAALAVVSVLMILFKQMAKIPEYSGQALKGAISLALVMGMLGGVMGAISIIASNGNWKNTLAVTAGLISVVIVLTTLFKGIASCSKSAKDGIIGAGVMALTLAAIGGVFSLLVLICSESDPEKILSLAAGLSIAVIALSVAFKIFASIGPIATGATSAVVPFLIFLGALTAVMLALGGVIALIDALCGEGSGKGVFEDAAAAFTLMGEAIGGFIGGIVGGIITGVAGSFISLIPDFSDAMVYFGQSMEKFFESAKKIDGKVVKSVGSLVLIMLMLTASSLLDGVGSWFGSSAGDGVVKFTDDLKKLAPGIVEFANECSKIEDVDALAAASSAAEVLGKLISVIPKEGGWWQSFFGSANIDKFSEGIKKLGPALVSFSTNARGINKQSVEVAADSAGMIAAFIDGFEGIRTGGWDGFWKGEVDYQHFSAWLPMLGSAIKSFGDNVDGLDAGNVKNATAAGSMIADFVDSFAGIRTGGWDGFWKGEVDYTKFNDGMPALGAAIAKFAHATEDITEDSVRGGVAAGELLAGLQKALPTEVSTFWGLFSTEKMSLSDFSAGVEMLGESIGKFNSSSSNIDPSKGRIVAAIVQTLIDLVNTITGGGDAGSLKTFSESLRAAGDLGVSKFVNRFSNSYTDLKSAVSTYLSAIIDSISENQSAATNAAGDMMDAVLAEFSSREGLFSMSADNSIRLYIAKVNEKSTEVTETFSELLTTAIGTLSEENSYIPNIFKNFGILSVAWIQNGIVFASDTIEEKIYKTFSDIASRLTLLETEFVDVGKQYVLGFTSGLEQNGVEVEKAADEVGKMSLRPLYHRLKINSPSKETRWAADMYIEGFASGLQQGTKKIVKNVGNVAATSKRSLVSLASDIGGATSDAYVKSANKKLDYTSYSDHVKNLFGSESEYKEAGKESAESLVSGVADGVKKEGVAVNQEIDDLVASIIRGEWGNGEERLKRLTEAGYNYDEVQAKVNVAWNALMSNIKTFSEIGTSISDEVVDSINSPQFVDTVSESISNSTNKALGDSDINYSNLVNTDGMEIDLGSVAISNESALSDNMSAAISNLDLSSGMEGLDIENLLSSDNDLDISSLLGGVSDSGISDDMLNELLNSISLSEGLDLPLDFESDLTADLYLNPVLDLDSIQNGSISPTLDYSDLNSALNNGTTANLAYDFAATTADYSEIIDEIERVRSDLSKFTTKVTDMVVVLDDGTLVGKILPKIDAGLGARATNSKRGN